MSFRKLSQAFFLKTNPIYRRLTHVMHIAENSIRRQQKTDEEVKGLGHGIAQMQETLERLEGELTGLKEEISTSSRQTRRLIEATIDITDLPKSAGVLRDMQDISFNMLREINRICKKHKLEYWLDFGTLLGAVRHQGFVPWDDDMDIAMIHTDYDKLLTVIDKELEDTDFRFIRVPSQIGKVVHKDFMPHGEEETKDFINWDVHNKIMFAMDISPYYYAKDTVSDDKLRDYIKQATEEKIKTQFDGGLTYAKFHKADKVVDKLHKKIAASESSDRVFMGLEGLAIKIFTRPWIVDTNSIFPLSTVKFEGGVFPAPRDTVGYLTSAYGDYMQLPSDPHKHIHLADMPIDELKRIRQAARSTK